MDRSLTAAGSQVCLVGRPEGAGQHIFTQGDGVGGVGRRCQKKHVVEGKRLGWGKGNRTRDKHRRLLFRLISACVMQAMRQAAICT